VKGTTVDRGRMGVRKRKHFTPSGVGGGAPWMKLPLSMLNCRMLNKVTLISSFSRLPRLTLSPGRGNLDWRVDVNSPDHGGQVIRGQVVPI
jgi:hypothetical protein